MQPEVGKIYEGKVTGITKFGAFVEIEPKVTGMVHISEVANTFVNEIKDHLTEGQQVKVKVLSISEEGKISLSIKKALPPPPKKASASRQNGQNRSGGQGGQGAGKNSQGGSKGNQSRKSGEKAAPKEPPTPESAFEDMMNRFKASSDERMSDIKKNIDSKRRNTSRRR